MIETPFAAHWLQVTSDVYPKKAVPFVASACQESCVDGIVLCLVGKRLSREIWIS